ncbi:GNAT family N-acetyltransferase [Candidatus Woesearchaeota archaeon]|nr:MAG: GNAT family N-acetyltransferase [Candidatus Woesearchaeota archaeon]
MEIIEKDVAGFGIRYSAHSESDEMGHAFLYVLRNELHEEPFGFMEDVWVEERFRGQGVGSALVRKVIEGAQEHNCYKLVCASKFSEERVHALYERLGFFKNGFELRIDF